MADLIFVRPKDGLRILDPVRRDRLPQGLYRQVERSGYWQRLSAMGDVTIATDVPPPEAEGYEPPAGAAATADPPGDASSGDDAVSGVRGRSK